MTDYRTPEQLEAQEQLQIAIEEHVRAFRTDLSAPVEIAGDWLVVAAVTSIDVDNDERRYAYHLGFSGGEQPEHIAYGLLKIGHRLIEEGDAS